MSKNKEVKVNKMNNVTFKFKDKKAKPVKTADICQFNITGADFKSEPLIEILTKAGAVSLD